MSLRPAGRSLRLRAGGVRRVPCAAAYSQTRFASRYETVERCPDPQCSCAPTPEMPDGLPIDRTGKMGMPYYDRHVVVAGDTDAQAWPSKIEQDEASLVRKLKDLLGPSGQCYRPDFSVSVTASTLPGSRPTAQTQPGSTHVYVFPDFVRLDVDQDVVGDSTNIKCQDLKSFGKAINTDGQLVAHNGTAIQVPVVLICGHGQRDQRCGILGPILQAEFERHLGKVNPASFGDDRTDRTPAFLGQVSHIGGHKFAGNVVIYIPPGYGSRGIVNNLAGHGIWYGRVEPKHVEGIVKETVLGGRVIKELLRGVHDFGRKIRNVEAGKVNNK